MTRRELVQAEEALVSEDWSLIEELIAKAREEHAREDEYWSAMEGEPVNLHQRAA